MSASDMQTCPHVMSQFATQLDCLKARDEWHVAALTAANRKLEYWQDLACANRKVAEDKHAKLSTYESVEVPEELAQIVFLRQLNNPTQRDKELLAYIDTLLRAYRAQAVRLSEAERDALESSTIWQLRVDALNEAIKLLPLGIEEMVQEDATVIYNRKRDQRDAALAQGRQGGE